MDRHFVNMITDRAELAIKTAFALDPLFRHLKINRAGGNIGALDACLKFSFVDDRPIFTGTKNEDTRSAGSDSTDRNLSLGFGVVGQEVLYGGKIYTLIRKRTKNYLALCKENGREYLIRFGGCTDVNNNNSSSVKSHA